MSHMPSPLCYRGLIHHFLQFFSSLSNPENAESGLTFTKDIENSMKLSSNIASEEEQLKWALAESMKTKQIAVDERSFLNDDSLPSSVIEINPLNRNEYENIKYNNTSETFTGLKEKNEKAFKVEEDKTACDRNDIHKSTEISEWSQKKSTENAYDPFLVEVTTASFKSLKAILSFQCFLNQPYVLS